MCTFEKCTSSVGYSQEIINVTIASINSRTTVRLGEYDTSTEQDCDDNSGECAGPVQELEVESVVHHALYSTSQRTNDIALVRLANPANTDESASKYFQDIFFL